MRAHLVCCLLILFVFFASSGYAVTYTFDASPNPIGSWEDPANWDVYPGTTINNGDIVIINSPCEIFRPTSSPSQLQIFNGGTIIANDTLRLFSKVDFQNDGQITVGSGSFLGVSHFQYVSTNTYNKIGSFENLANGNITIGQNAGFYYFAIIDNSFGGTMNLNGSIRSWRGEIIGPCINAGQISPGQSPGKMTVNGDYTATSTASLLIEVGGNGGSGAPNGHDELEVLGTASLDGDLIVELIYGFFPVSGNAYQIMSYTSHTGAFSSVTLPDISPLNWNIQVNATNILATVTGAFPVELMDFQAEPVLAGIQLDWATASELNNEGFRIEHKHNSDWESIGYTPGTGTTQEVQRYQFTDSNPANGMNAYRLVQIDLDGTETPSRMAEVQFEGNNSIRLYPNPAHQQITIENPDQQPLHFIVYSTQGEIVQQGKLHARQAEIDIRSLAAGMYILSTHTQSGNSRITFVKE